MRTMRSKMPVLIAAAALCTALIVALLVSGSSPKAPTEAAQSEPAAEGHFPDDEASTALRTLAVYTDAEPAPSSNSERMRGLLIGGDLPHGATEATVLTDEDCEADQKGVSHCRNQLELPSGKKITIRHPHRMQDVPCMAPGERVRVSHAPGQHGVQQ